MKAETKKDQNVNSKTNPSLKIIFKTQRPESFLKSKQNKITRKLLGKKTFEALIERKHISFVCFERLLGLGEENKNR
jgi:hypothetical protein